MYIYLRLSDIILTYNSIKKNIKFRLTFMVITCTDKNLEKNSSLLGLLLSI